MTTRPGVFHFEVQQGDTFNDVWTITDSAGSPVDLTGYTARMHVRDVIDASTTLLSLSSGSGIALGGAAGTVTFAVPAATTAALPAGPAVYDLELTSGGGVVTTWVRGNLLIARKVTRA